MTERRRTSSQVVVMDVVAEHTYRSDFLRVEAKGDDAPGFQGRMVPEGHPYFPKLPAGTFGIVRADGTLKAAEFTDITVVDRNRWPLGDVVVSEDGRVGAVTGFTTVLDLVKLGDDGEPAAAVAMSGVSPDSLRRVRELSLGDFVVSGAWLGRVLEVSLNFSVAFDDGAVCKVIGDERSKKLLPVATTAGARRRRYFRSQMNTRLYPGQRVTGPVDMFKTCRWLYGCWNPCRRVGTVSKVEMAGVRVCWVASAHDGVGTDPRRIQASAPPAYQKPSNLTYFCSAMECLWSIGDRCFVREQDEPSSSPEAAAAGKKPLSRKQFLRQRRARRGQRRHEEIEQPMTVASTSTTVDVLWWQDGTRQRGVPSKSLMPYTLTILDEFFPELYVIDKAATRGGDDEASGGRRVGVVRSVSFEDQTVGVSWCKEASSSPEEDVDTVSAYDLAWRKDNFVYYGNVVLRPLPPPGCSEDRSATAVADLSWVGRVVDLRDGRAQVRWGDGSTSMVLPHEISVVREHHYSDLQAKMDTDDSSSSSSSSESEDDTEEDAINNTHPANNSNVQGDNDVSVDEDGTAATRASRLRAIVQPVLRLIVQVLAQAMRYLPNRLSPSSSSSSELDAPTAIVGTPARVTDGHDDTNNGDAIHDTAAAATSDDDDAGADDDDFTEKGESTVETTGFPHFDVTQSPPDHHYLDSLDQGSNGGKKWVKAVQKEWKILENNLPDTIYVRAFEDRMDLVRAVMVGATGTPYQDGLFFFDMHLPPTYPDEPPLVYYHSFGLNLNPNLYDSGTVCLSLLGTFGGEGSEEWLPATSTLLQVVVSIQGLILNDQPFFNEAGYEALANRPEGRRNAPPYRENAYLLTLRSMLHLLRRPPQGFEEFVRDHFRRQGRFVLGACEAYLRGCIVGTLDSEARATEESKEEGRKCSGRVKAGTRKPGCEARGRVSQKLLLRGVTATSSTDCGTCSSTQRHAHRSSC